MRKILPVLFAAALVALVAWPFLAWAQAAQVTLVSSDRSFGAVPEPTYSGTITIACNTGGTASATLPAGTYEQRVQNEMGSLCDGATCASGGSSYGPGESRFYRFNVAAVKSCRAANGTAIVQFTPVRF